MASTKGLYPTLVANAVINALSSPASVVLNIITVQALRKTPSMPKTLKTLLLSLAVSDLGVGLLVQPMYVARLVMEIKQHSDNIVYHGVCNAFTVQANLLSFPSYIGIVALTVDRFLAIHLHLRYQELVTHKRVVAVVSSVWVSGGVTALLSQLSLLIFSAFLGTIATICFIITGIFYCKIYAAVKHHSNQIHALQAAQNEDMVNATRVQKSALATFYVYVGFLVCYLPMSCAGIAKAIGETPLLSHLWYFTFTLMYLNSSLNPLIYCWKMRYIRQTVMDILQNIFP